MHIRIFHPKQALEIQARKLDRAASAKSNRFMGSWTRAATLDAVIEGRSILRNGHRGRAIGEAQRLLNFNGTKELAVDGFYGPLTRSAVEAFQRSHGLEVDGIVGPKTLAVLWDLTLRDLPLEPRFAALPESVQRLALSRLEDAPKSEQRALLQILLSEPFAALDPQAQTDTLEWSPQQLRLVLEV